jgi:hypothetical protein
VEYPSYGIPLGPVPIIFHMRDSAIAAPSHLSAQSRFRVLR